MQELSHTTLSVIYLDITIDMIQNNTFVYDLEQNINKSEFYVVILLINKNVFSASLYKIIIVIIIIITIGKIFVY